MAEIIDEETNIYKICRKRANEASGNGAFSSRDKAQSEFSKSDIPISAASLKDYESDKTTPFPETVKHMAKVYGTPELKWMHCSRKCPIGQEIAKTDDEIGSDDIYFTYFELAGSFDKVHKIEQQLHSIISDRKLNENEKPMMREILNVMDRITENAKDLRIWIEKQGINLYDV